MLGLAFTIGSIAPGLQGSTAPTPAQTPAFATVNINGDSITDNTGTSGYADRYIAHRTDKSVVRRSQGSRATGTAANLNDGSNTLFGHLADDHANNPGLAFRLIGANDLQAVDAPTYRQRQIDYSAAVKAAKPGIKLVWSAPIPFDPAAGAYATFNPRRTALMSTARDPAVWGQWADYYIPLGEHPDWIEVGGATMYQDGVHPTAAGQALLLAQFKAAMDTILDPARVNATGPYNAVWPADEGSVGSGQTITRRFLLSGLKWTGVAGNVSVTGSGSPQVRVNGGSYGANAGQSWIYNGDVVDLKVTLGAAGTYALDLAIGSETRTITFTAVAPALPSVQTGTMPQAGNLKLFLRADDVASIKQSNAGTGAITANAQPVGYWADQSGNGFHLSSPADGSARPIFNTDGTLGWLTFDGVDDYLRRLNTAAQIDLWALGGAGGYTMMMAVEALNPAASTFFVTAGRNQNGPFMSPLGASTGTPSAKTGAWYQSDGGVGVLGNGSFTATDAYDGTPNVLTLTDNGAEVRAYADGALGTGSPRAYTRAGNTITTNTFAIGGLLRSAIGGPYASMKLSALAIWPGVLAEAERAQAQTLFARIQGRVL